VAPVGGAGFLWWRRFRGASVVIMANTMTSLVAPVSTDGAVFVTRSSLVFLRLIETEPFNLSLSGLPTTSQAPVGKGAATTTTGVWLKSPPRFCNCRRRRRHVGVGVGVVTSTR
jgi:hypothetical protein